jgi:hypothetical protein
VPLTVSMKMLPRPPALDPDSEPVAFWRWRQLRAAGVPAALAAALARDCAIDLHSLLGLIDKGCPPELAVRILAPLDAEPHPC